MSPMISIVILTYCRPDEIQRNVRELLDIRGITMEVIVVDNASEIPVANFLPKNPKLKVITMSNNIGVAARNTGIKAASGDLVFTLDDDVFGLNFESIKRAEEIFNQSSKLAALNFRVIDDLTEEQINWIHHRKVEEFGMSNFDTYEISEGAVAFRRSLLMRTNLYPEAYFISHEGPDLALQLIKLGFGVRYNGEISLRHSHSDVARVNWRRYYYDTRNNIWLSVRHFPSAIMIKKIFIGIVSMFVYSLRDGFFLVYIRGLYDGIRGIGLAIKDREPLKGEAMATYSKIESNNAPISYMLKKRLFVSKVRI